jgi:hypothetical protein
MGLIKDLLIPQIYLLNDRKQFVYTRGKVRIVFDYLELFEGEAMGSYCEINTLFLLKDRRVDTNSYNSYLVFDLNGSAVAVMPYSSKSFFYGSGGIYLTHVKKEMDSHFNNLLETERMTMKSFYENQHDILVPDNKEVNNER